MCVLFASLLAWLFVCVCACVCERHYAGVKCCSVCKGDPASGEMERDTTRWLHKVGAAHGVGLGVCFDRQIIVAGGHRRKSVRK